MSPEYAVPRGMAVEGFPAMGTTVSVAVPAPQRAHVELVRGLFAEWERTLSRFLPESELSRVNARAGEGVVVSPLLLRVLQAALAAARATDGLYDPTLGRQIALVGYDRSFDVLPAWQPAMDALAGPGGGWRDIELDASQARIRVPPRVSIDFGGIAKGMAVDAALDALVCAGVTTALVNAGGDLAVRGVPPDTDAWPLAVEDGGRQWLVALRAGALATSGIARHHWVQGDTPRHHLLDPRTGQPTRSDLRAVTAAAATCAQAEVAAKVALLLGAHGGSAFLRAHGLAGLLVRHDGQGIATGPWPREGDVAEADVPAHVAEVVP